MPERPRRSTFAGAISAAVRCCRRVRSLAALAPTTCRGRRRSFTRKGSHADQSRHRAHRRCRHQRRAIARQSGFRTPRGDSGNSPGTGYRGTSIERRTPRSPFGNPHHRTRRPAFGRNGQFPAAHRGTDPGRGAPLGHRSRQPRRGLQPRGSRAGVAGLVDTALGGCPRRALPRRWTRRLDRRGR